MAERLLIDLDGVLKDFIGGLNKVYLKYYPDHKIKPVTSRDLDKFYPIGYDIYNFVFEHHQEITENANIYPGVQESFRQYKDVYDLIIVTSQEEWGVEDTYYWIEKHNLPVKDIVISFEKHKVEGFALLDDYEINVEMFLENGRLGVCLERPWNSSWQKGPKVKNVENFFKLVDKKIKGVIDG